MAGFVKTGDGDGDQYGDGGLIDVSKLEAKVIAALAQLAFNDNTPAQSRVAALKELREILKDQPQSISGPGGELNQDPGTLTLKQIRDELGTG